MGENLENGHVIPGEGCICELAFAGRALLEEAQSVRDADLRRAVLVQALGSLAEMSATLENRMVRDARHPAAMGEGERHSELANCMLGALADDVAAYREAAALRARVYQALDEPAAAETCHQRARAFCDVWEAYGRPASSDAARSERHVPTAQ